MANVIHFFTMIILLIIIYQDLTSRMVYFFCFPLLAGLFFVMQVKVLSIEEISKNILVTSGFLSFQFLVLAGYFYIKKKDFTSIKDSIGLGDILFLISLCFLFSPFNYILFYISSLCATLIFVLVFRLIVKSDVRTIPLAGIQAIFLTIVLCIQYFSAAFKCNSDSYLLNLIGI